MPETELSDECKQKLRDLDRGLALVIQRLQDFDYAESAAISDRTMLPLMNEIAHSDEPCREFLRTIDQSAGALSFIARLELGNRELENGGSERLIGELMRVRVQIHRYL